LAVGLLTVVFMVHYEYLWYLDQPATISWVVKDTAAEKAGLQPGDRIVRIDDIQNPTWAQIAPKEALSPNQPLHIIIERDGHTLDKTIVPEAAGISQIGYAGWVQK